jgi:predicted Fe-Mo cluster-binding NifX family protein
MKVCVTGRQADPESGVDPRFGRAGALLIADTEQHELEVLEGATDAAHGAGVQAAQAVIGAGAEAVITGEVGPKALGVLEAAGIPVYRASALSVADALEAFRNGELELIDKPGGRPHQELV